MASEITVSANFSVTKGGGSSSGTMSKTQDLAGDTFVGITQNLAGTTKEAVVFPSDMTLGGWVFIRNMTDDSSGAVTPTIIVSLTAAAADNTFTIATLLPGEGTLFKPAAGATISLTPSATCVAFIGATEL